MKTSNLTISLLLKFLKIWDMRSSIVDVMMATVIV
jgi:hypothetical protein